MSVVFFKTFYINIGSVGPKKKKKKKKQNKDTFSQKFINVKLASHTHNDW